MDVRFGQSVPYSIGIEEELQIVDAETLELASRVEDVLAGCDETLVGSRIKPELMQCMVEAVTGVAGTVAKAVQELGFLRERLRRAAGEHDALIVSAGSHPFSRLGRQEVTRRPRYIRHIRRLGWAVTRQVVFGLHVHVGVNSAEKAVACANGMRAIAPALLALSANSPFWEGHATGLASTRSQIFEGLPHSGLPPELSDFDEFVGLVERGERTGCIPDYTHVWWDVRPHPELGTVEVRICDAQTRLESTAAIAALVQSAVATLGGAFECGEPHDPVPAFILEENKWRAARDGLQARLIDASNDAEIPASEVVRELVERCAAAADALGCAEELALAERILERGTGADEQIRVHGETGSLPEVVRVLVDESAPKRMAGLAT